MAIIQIIFYVVFCYYHPPTLKKVLLNLMFTHKNGLNILYFCGFGKKPREIKPLGKTSNLELNHLNQQYRKVMISQKRFLQQRDMKFPVFVPRKFILLIQHFLAYTWEEEINSILTLDNSNNCSLPFTRFWYLRQVVNLAYYLTVTLKELPGE